VSGGSNREDSRDSIARPGSEAVVAFFFLVSAALAIASWCNDPLSYDGAYYMFHILDTQATLSPYGRFVNVPLQLPMLLVSHHTDNFTILRLVFSVSYGLVPAFTLTACWLICRKTKRSLFIWPALSMCLAGLPGQFAFYAEAIIGTNLLWPVLLCALTGFPLSFVPIAALATAGALFAYPAIATHLLCIAAVALWYAWTKSRARERELLYGAGIAVLALVRILEPLSTYEKQTLSVRTLEYTLQSVFLGWPIIAVLATSLAAAAIVWQNSLDRASRIAEYLALLSIGTAGLVLVFWALEPRNWIDAQGYRFWYPGIALLLMIAASVDALYGDDEYRNKTVQFWNVSLIIISSAFFIVLSIQSIWWATLSHRLAATLQITTDRCISKSSLSWMQNSPLHHWSSNYYALDLQSRKPGVLILDDDDCAVLKQTGVLRLTSFTSPQPDHDGWFDFSQVRSTK
jgi:hypothetical protein